MFIVFEGIDGSGKTTISNRVALRLRQTGLSVTHVREDGTFTSPTAQAIRELGRDARNLMLSPLAELMLYVARDGQSLEEMILPALGRADVVIADRFLYSAQLLATAGRGLAAEVVEPVIAAFTCQVRPDLAILVDAPPDIARARRRVSKLLSPSSKRPPSRKGLAGGGLQVRMSRAHRQLAEAHPETWLIVDNDDAKLDDLVAAVTAAIATAVRHGVAAGLAEGRRLLPTAGAAMPSGLETAADARTALLAWVDRRAGSEPDLAAYVLGGCVGADIDARRRTLAQRAPVVVAHGLAGLDNAEAWRLREELAAAAPVGVARSLGALTGHGAYAWRRALAAAVPEAVAASLNGLDDSDAWALRDALRAVAPDAVTASLGGIDSARADAERRRWLAAQPAEGPTTYAAARAGVNMVSGRGDDLSWRVRQVAFNLAPVEAIASMRGDDSPRAWRWRDTFATRAPRPVVDSLDGMPGVAAWRLRGALAGNCRETFQSMIGLDDSAAWELRERHALTWPSTVCKSLGVLAGTLRGRTLVSALLRAHGGVSLLRNAVKADQLAGAGATTGAPAPAVRQRAAIGT